MNTSITLHEVTSIDVVEQQAKQSNTRRGEYYATKVIIKHLDGGETEITCFLNDRAAKNLNDEGKLRRDLIPPVPCDVSVIKRHQWRR